MTDGSEQTSMRPHSARLEALGAMASGIAHEINTPIQFIGDNLQFISDSFSAIDRLLQRYEATLAGPLASHDSTDALGDLAAAREEADIDYLRRELPSAIEQSLAGIQQVARIASAMKTFAHRGSAEKEMADINQAIETTATICRNEWKYDADLELSLASSLPMAPCHVGELSQVWLNLIVNAAHAIRARPDLDRGLITITTSASDSMVQVTVADNGAGMTDEVRKRVFEPFFSTMDAGKGSGQGLAICRSIVTSQHGGEIELSSEAGRGSRFTVRLPLGVEAGGGSEHEEALA